jgi:hypothetical protein
VKGLVYVGAAEVGAPDLEGLCSREAGTEFVGQSRMHHGVLAERQSILWLDLSLWLLDRKRAAEMHLHLW